MSTRIIPTRTDGVQWYDISIDLDDVTYVLEFSWNPIGLFWAMTIRDRDENILISERRIVVGELLLSRFRDIRLPAGEMMAIDTTGADIDPGVTELGEDARVALLYMDAADMPSSYVAAP